MSIAHDRARAGGELVYRLRELEKEHGRTQAARRCEFVILTDLFGFSEEFAKKSTEDRP